MICKCASLQVCCFLWSVFLLLGTNFAGPCSTIIQGTLLVSAFDVVGSSSLNKRRPVWQSHQQVTVTTSRTRTRTTRTTILLWMGLYDTPLPPRDEASGGDDDDGDVKAKRSSILSSLPSAEEELAAFKDRLAKMEQTKQRSTLFSSGGVPDENWLPCPNPKPVDDEPWFTG